jgi:hypothetical protein
VPHFAVLLDRLAVCVLCDVVAALWCCTCALLVFSCKTKRLTFRCLSEKKRGKSFFKTKHHEFVGIFFAIFHNVKEITMADSLKVTLEKENKVP